MKNFPYFILGLLLTSNALSADTVLSNGSIYTVDPEHPWAEAVAIKDSRFVYVGDSEGVQKFIGRDTVEYDLKGQFVLPGIVDSHTHPGKVARSVDYVDLPWAPETKKEMFDALVAYADENPDKE